MLNADLLAESIPHSLLVDLVEVLAEWKDMPLMHVVECSKPIAQCRGGIGSPLVPANPNPFKPAARSVDRGPCSWIGASKRAFLARPQFVWLFKPPGVEPRGSWSGILRLFDLSPKCSPPPIVGETPRGGPTKPETSAHYVKN